ncbi:MAG TPA: DUF58 domain-containing protein [Solirubrobacteraceae bacterium]
MGRVLVAGGLLVLVALTFDAAVLLVPGVALMALGLAIPAWIRLAARGSSVSRRIHGDRVVEEQPLEATIEVRRGPLGLPGGEVLDEFAGAALALTARGAPPHPGGSSSLRVVARFPRRGRRRFEPPELAVRDPLGLVRVTRAGAGSPQELLVLPRTERITRLADDTGLQPESAAVAAAAEAFAATEVDGLRPYRPGAPASRIHWPALARGAGLLERRLRADADSGPLVVLDSRTAGPPELLDAAVRAAASLALELARSTGCEVLLPGERRPTRIAPDLVAWPAVHARLALIEEGPDAPAPSLGSRPHAGRVYYVVAGSPGQAERLPLETRARAVLVAPLELARTSAHPALFDVAGCRAFLLDGRRIRDPARAA